MPEVKISKETGGAYADIHEVIEDELERIEREHVSKYGNKKTEVDGIVFDSKREANRYGELKLLQRAGEISDLATQVKMAVEFRGKHVCNYIADFVYQEKGKKVVEDCKGYRTQVYKLKKKLVEAVYDVKIIET